MLRFAAVNKAIPAASLAFVAVSFYLKPLCGWGGALLLGVVTPGCMTGKEESVLVAEDGEERGRERGKEEKLRAGLVNLCRTVRWL